MEVTLLKKLKLARSYIKFLRVFKRCGVCYRLAGAYCGQADKMKELKEKLCPNCSKALRDAGEVIIQEVKK